MAEPSAPRVPPRIGPYRVVARLASGGMAEIYLAKMSGAARFERAVAIKRALPHLAHEPELRSTLLDEARIMSRIRHPNVVSVQELAEDEDSLFLVMEFLRGENLAGLTRALRAHGERLDPSLAVMIVSELCAGLHAARELTDEQGRPLRVVHRDVSPSNVFVTFDGEVKLLDFGIARYEDRAAVRTGTGICKGKFAYMAPEQYGGENVDHRADVFALGVILHELLTGRRLFLRDTEVQTLKAIVSDRYPTPREHQPDLRISDELEEIVVKALCRRAVDRFPTAEAMRLALRAQLRVLDPDHDARERLSDLVRRVLPEKLAQTQEMIRRVREDASPIAFPLVAAEIPDERSVVEVQTKAEKRQATSSELESAPNALPLGASALERVVGPPSAALRRAPRARARALAVGAAAIGLAALVIGTAAVLPRAIADTPPQPAAPVPTAPPPTAPPVERSSAPELPTSVRVRVQTTPAGARVLVQGELRCHAPCDLDLVRGSEAVEVAIEHEGFVSVREAIEPILDQRVVVRLVPEPRRAAASRPRPRLTPEREEPRFYSFD